VTDQSDHPIADDEMCRRFARLCEMTQDMLDRMTSAQRDRMKQEHLAAARGPTNNLRLLCEMTDVLHLLRKQPLKQGSGGSGKWLSKE